MKKIIFVFIVFISSYNYAQQELKLDIADAIILKTIEFSYENYITDQTSFGASILYSFEEKKSDFRYNEQFMFTPYVRHYFTAYENWNLFGEGFLGISTGYKEIELDDAQNIYEDYSDGALGIAFGTKYVAKGGLVIDIYGGLGRNLFSSNSPVIVPRIGVNVGWRF